MRHSIPTDCIAWLASCEIARADALTLPGPSFAAIVTLGTIAIAGLFMAFLQQRRAAAALARARFFEHHEVMTGLFNRPHFLDVLRGAMTRRRPHEHIAVFAIDLEGVRDVNDLLGNAAGDTIIRLTARALERVSGSNAIVARLSGDNFAVARLGLRNVQDAASFAATLLEAISQPQRLNGHEVMLSARIGVALAPGDSEEAAHLLKAAGLALDRACLGTGSGFTLFEKSFERALQERRELEVKIRETLEKGGFDLHFQPLFRAGSNRLAGFEALLRMPDGQGGFIPPVKFIPVAEEMGLIVEIGDWVLRRACMLAAHWPDHLSIAVNLSPAQFSAGHMSRRVRDALGESGLRADRLELEITEGLILKDDASILGELRTLKALGVAIVLDDFGTGYSSLSYLWKFPFDKIKIDRSFTDALDGEDRQVVEVLQAIMSLGRSLRLRITAEGVETGAQASFLKSLGCDEVQGYYFGRPMPVDQVALTILADAARALSDATASAPAARLAAAG
ncbi:putative bifunctional diguanylate cyclase/phosphodiesterase [Microvirga massiliensis]|uniref:putative bifunctional diguanylate cyclase/phosphodiesterase n=1 Tax=Microvirga massiliensis TaxID=1033741 RepID=UPI00065FB665|nr:bifunctional diguanylate cyclase/phosphodiesterase [Microvirga massiliensis]